MSDCLIIIDDDSDEIEWMTSALKAVDSQVKFVTFIEAMDALEYIASMEGEPLGVILDLNMPQLNGLDFLKSEPVSTRSIRVIVQSSSEPPQKILQEIELLGASFVVKPYAYSGYKENLRSLLSKWGSTRL